MKCLILIIMVVFLFGCEKKGEQVLSTVATDVEIFEIDGAICIWKDGYKAGGLSCDFTNFVYRVRK